LGFCGPHQRKGQLLRSFLEGKTSNCEVREVLKQFKAAYPYYCLIAKSNGIKDPFNFDVIYAYWIGNNLLEKVSISDLRRVIAEEFSGPGLLPKKIARKKAAAISKSVLPHHSFHVLSLGAISGAVDISTPAMKDLCRISWGQIENIKRSEKIMVSARYQPLIKKIRKMKLGKPVLKEFLWDPGLLPNLKVGDWVSFHWGEIIQILTPEDVKNLEKYTQRILNA
jgi:hypothetical protein